MRSNIPALFCMTVLVVLVCGIAHASGGGGEHGSSVMDWVWRFLNFGILVVVLVWFLGKPMKAYFRQRTELIEKSIKEASDAREAAERALKEVEEKLRMKDQEIEKIMEAARRSGETDRDALIEDGRRMSEQIREKARINIEQELKQAREELKAEAAAIALEIAEKKIRERLSEEDQVRLLEESLKKIEEQNG